MPRKQLQNMQLPESGYNPVVFQGYTAEGPEYDTNILANSIGRLDTAIEKAHEGLSAIDLALAEQGSKLNEAEGAWFKQFKDNFKNQIQAEIDAGNFGNAINLGKELGAQAVSDKGLNARIQYNQDLEKYKDEILANDRLSTNKKKWAINKYAQYNYEDRFENGKVVGGNTFDRTNKIADSFNPDQEWILVEKIVAEESGGGGGTTNDSEKGISIRTSSDYRRKLKDKLVNGMVTRFKNSAQLRRELAEELDADLYNLEDLNKQYDELLNSGNVEEAARIKARIDEEDKYLTWNNARVKDIKTYYALKILNSGYPELMEYNNVSGRSDESIIGKSEGNYTSGNFISEVVDGMRNTYRPSVSVKWAGGQESSSTAATTAGQNIYGVGDSGIERQNNPGYIGSFNK